VALLVLGFGAVSRLAQSSPITPPMVFVAAGAGVAALGGFGLTVESGLIHGLAELTLVLVLFTDASRIDLRALRRDESLPVRIRQTLNVESGLNDGLTLPAVLILASVVGATEDHRDTAEWFTFAAAAVTLGPLVGWVVGRFGGQLVERATRHAAITRPFEQLSALGLAVLAFAGAELIGGNGFIATFVAGLTLGNTWHQICECLHEFGEAEGQLLTLLVFLAFGAVMVPEALQYLTWQSALYALASLTIVRMVPVVVALLGSGLRWPFRRQAARPGW
jgi:NhaP-type Na+/H+ or K+/H+ antiporter